MNESFPRVDAREKATGCTCYLDDIKLPGMLYGKILRSPYPHARIKSIDTSGTLNLSGVRSVLTAQDVPQTKFSFLASMADKTMLCMDKVRYVGDEVAAVAADTLETAEEAIRRIKVDYEPLPYLDSPLEAVVSDTLIHEDKPNNIAFKTQHEFGDIDKAFAEADLIFEDEYETSIVNHCCLETRGCIASFQMDGRLILWAPTQAPHTLREELHRILGLPIHLIRVICTPAGGAFGSRLVMDMKEPLSALLSSKTNRPVKIVNTREEEFITGKTRYPWKIDIKTGTTKEGRIVVWNINVIADNGAYNDKGPATLGWGRTASSVLYGVPNVRYGGQLIYTNRQMGTAFRGFGGPQIHFAIECQLDSIAKKIGLDPKDIRMINANKANTKTPSGIHIKSCEMDRCIEEAAQRIDWSKRRNDRELAPKTNVAYGIGMASFVHTGAGNRKYYYNASDAFLKYNPDGLLSIYTSAVEIGQGASTAMAKIAAEVLGLKNLERIVVLNSDTDLMPYDLGAWGSRTTFVCGNAVLKAANTVKKELLEIASELFDINSGELDCRDEKIFVKSDPGESRSLDEVLAYCYRKKGLSISAKGSYVDELASSYTFETGVPTFSFGCMAVDVEVDLETGKVKVINAVSVIDAGRIINKLAAEGQVEGSIAQGIGFALTERTIYQGGNIINSDFRDYKLLHVSDMPQVEVHFVEVGEPDGPLGAKGLGEAGIIPVAPAILNALSNALGISFKKLPALPEEILAAIKGLG